VSIPDDRLSTTILEAEYLDPDGRDRELDEDYEMGPVDVNDPSLGLMYQVWKLTYNPGTSDLSITSEITLQTYVGVLNIPNLTQCSLAFDQSGHLNISYTAAGVAFRFWYDTSIADHVTTNLGADVIGPQLTLDDKRDMEVGVSDVLMWYTRQQPDLSYNLYYTQQRDRYEDERLLTTNVRPYVWKLGMHIKLRVQVSLRTI
jgi:hypothetical protein